MGALPPRSAWQRRTHRGARRVAGARRARAAAGWGAARVSSRAGGRLQRGGRGRPRVYSSSAARRGATGCWRHRAAALVASRRAGAGARRCGEGGCTGLGNESGGWGWGRRGCGAAAGPRRARPRGATLQRGTAAALSCWRPQPRGRWAPPPRRSARAPARRRACRPWAGARWPPCRCGRASGRAACRPCRGRGRGRARPCGCAPCRCAASGCGACTVEAGDGRAGGAEGVGGIHQRRRSDERWTAPQAAAATQPAPAEPSALCVPASAQRCTWGVRLPGRSAWPLALVRQAARSPGPGPTPPPPPHPGSTRAAPYAHQVLLGLEVVQAAEVLGQQLVELRGGRGAGGGGGRAAA